MNITSLCGRRCHSLIRASLPLQWAAEGGHKDVVALLLAYNADVDAMSHGGFTPLHFAVAEGFADAPPREDDTMQRM
jgi:ankyrin repeat protein